MRTLRRILTWGRCPQTPGIFRFPPEWIYFGERAAPAPGPFRPLSRCSGCVPAAPYPPLRYSQSGRHQPRRATIFCRTAIPPLTHCLTPRVHFTQVASPLSIAVVLGPDHYARLAAAKRFIDLVTAGRPVAKAPDDSEKSKQ